MNSPLATADSDPTQDIIPSTFSDLLPDQELVASLERLNIRTPTPIQAATLPHTLEGRDVIAQAKTGSGKTLAFVLPILAKLKTLKGQRDTLALVLTPTRELALQVTEVVRSLQSDIAPACIIGGQSMGAQIKALRKDARFIVGTPGRVLDLISQREILLRKCQHFVLDEADEMLSMGFIDEVRSILVKLPSASARQGMFFSATVTPRVQMLADSFLRRPLELKGDLVDERPSEITHLYCRVGAGVTVKADALCKVLETTQPESAIIFCNTKSDTELVEVILRRRGFQVGKINSDLSQSERNKIMTSVRQGEVKLLVATDIAARGIDIDHIDLVVNYSLHDQPETYVHRTGRTGRAGRAGRAVSIVAPQDFTNFYTLGRSLSLEMNELELSH